ncbi:MAG TPA: Holliday junction resolvase RuvX [Chryseolinea sp.]|nr:Holliday junction resolvase RuvX [Chryseolinea sp.]
MGRILAFDYGLKRTGLAVTDPLRIIATPLETVSTNDLFSFLTDYLQKETVDEFVVGMPKTLSNQDSEIAPMVRKFVENLTLKFPGKQVHLADERFTSRLAMQAMIDGGMKKKNRQVKSNVDRISATIILQSFLEAVKR